MIDQNQTIPADPTLRAAADPSWLQLPPNPPPPLQQGLAASGESLHHLPDECVESLFNPERVYGFSRFACCKGDGGVTLKPEEALIGRFMAHKIRKSKNDRDGRQWFYITGHELSSRLFPWIADSTMQSHLNNLKRKSVLICPQF